MKGGNFQWTTTLSIPEIVSRARAIIDDYDSPKKDSGKQYIGKVHDEWFYLALKEGNSWARAVVNAVDDTSLTVTLRAQGPETAVYTDWKNLISSWKLRVGLLFTWFELLAYGTGTVFAGFLTLHPPKIVESILVATGVWGVLLARLLFGLRSEKTRRRIYLEVTQLAPPVGSLPKYVGGESPSLKLFVLSTFGGYVIGISFFFLSDGLPSPPSVLSAIISFLGIYLLSLAFAPVLSCLALGHYIREWLNTGTLTRLLRHDNWEVAIASIAVVMAVVYAFIRVRRLGARPIEWSIISLLYGASAGFLTWIYLSSYAG